MPPITAERGPRRALLALALALAATLAPAAPALASTLSVDDDGADCPNARFTSLQAAIDQAAPYDTVAICAGTYKETAPAFEGTGRNGLLIRKNLTLKGAGADKVFIRPSATPTDTLAGDSPTLLDGGGNVITIARQSLGSTDESEISVTISGVTVQSPDVYAEAGIAFNNTSGRVIDSVVGPLRRATTSSELSSRPLGWGIVASNSFIGTESTGEPRRRVHVERTRVTGYQAGGIRIDAARQATPNTRSGMVEVGEVVDTEIQGAGSDPLIPQTGLEFHAGARGAIDGSRITANFFPSNQRQSAGILLTDANTTGANWTAGDSIITGNGYGVFNANIDNSAIRVGAPADATDNYWGPGGHPVEAPSSPSTGVEGVSGNDSNGADSVLVDPFLSVAPSLTTGPAPVTDLAPTVAIGDPAAGSVLPTDAPTAANVAAGDDYGVKSVALKLGGTVVGTDTSAPYEFSFTPPASTAGTTQTLTATATDSSGQTTDDTITVSIRGTAGGGGMATTPDSPGSPLSPAGSGENLPPLLLRSVGGLGSASVRPEKGFDLTLDTAEATRATYKLGGKVVCAPAAAPFRCAYKPTTADIGRKQLTITIADDRGRTTSRELTLTIQRFRNAAVKARAVTKSGGRTKVSGTLVRPARVSAARGCAAGSVAVRVGKRKAAAKLTRRCRFSLVVGARGKTTVRFRGNAVLLPSKTKKVKVG